MSATSASCSATRLTAYDVKHRAVVFDRFADPIELREFWKRNYGPTIAVYRFNAEYMLLTARRR